MEELQKKAAGGLAAFQQFKNQGPIVGFEDIDASDIKMPRIKLLQAQSDEAAESKGKPGQYYNTVTGEVFDSLDVIFLTFGKQRVRWPEKFKRGDDPLCRSADAHKSDEDGVDCASCSYAKWGKNKEKPECSLSYAWLGCVDAPQKNYPMFRTVVTAASMVATKDFINQIVQYNLPPFIFKVTLSSKLMKNDKGSFYVMEYSFKQNEDGSPATINPNDYSYFEEKCKNMRGMFIDARKNDLKSMSNEMTDADIETSDESAVF